MALRCSIVLFVTFISAFTAMAEDGAKGTGYNIAKFEDPGYFDQWKHEKQSQVKLSEKYEYYDIEGTTPAELKSQMKRKGTKWDDGRVYAALTTWDVKYDYDINYSEGIYQIGSIKTSVDILFNFPRLSKSVQLPDQVNASWNGYLENLTKHELGHRNIAVAIGEEIHETLAGIGGNPSKSDLEEEAERLVRAKLKKLKKEQIEYDHETCHGEKQGAVLM